MSDDPFKIKPKEQPAENIPQQDLPNRFVTDPLGNKVQVPHGMDERDVMNALQRQYRNDPNVLRELQIRDQVGAEDPRDPEFRRSHLARQADGPVEPGDVGDFLVRADLSLSDLLTEKYQKLKNYYPEADLRLVNDIDGEPTILIRQPGDTHYKEVEAPEFSADDIAALAGMAPEVAGEIIAFLGSRGGTTIARGMIRAFMGASAGEGAKSVLESTRGFEHSSSGAIVERMVSTGGVAATGYGILDPIARIINTTRGVGQGLIVPIKSTSAEAAEDIATRRGLPGLMPGQVHPLYESMQKQAAAVTSTMQEFTLDRAHQVFNRIAGIRDEIGDVSKLTDVQLNSLIEKERANIIKSLGSVPEMTFSSAGIKVQKGISAFQEMLVTREARAYKAAFDVSKARGGVRFNVDPIKQIAAHVKADMPADLTFDNLGVSVALPLVRAEGISRTPAFKEAIEAVYKMGSEVRLTPQNASSVEQMVRLRSTFYNLSKSQDLTGTERHVAGEIHKTLTAIMERPRNLRGKTGNVRPSVAKAWQRANSLTVSRGRFESRIFGRLSAVSDRPSALAKKLGLNDPDLVREVRRSLKVSGNKDGWIATQKAFERDLLNNPTAIRKKFETADKETLNMLVPPERQKDLIRVSDEWAKLEKTPIKKMLRAATEEGDRAIEIINKGTRPQIRSYIEEIGGKDTPMGKALQAGIIESLMRKSTHMVKGRLIVNEREFLSGIKKFRDRGVLDEVFGESTQKNIVEDLETYFSFMPSGVGAGESILAAEAASGMAGAAFPVTPAAISRAVGAAHTLTKFRIISWAFITPGARKMLFRSKDSKGKGVNPVKIGELGALIALISDNMDKTATEGINSELGDQFQRVLDATVPDLF